MHPEFISIAPKKLGTKSNDGNVVAALLLRITTRPELNCLKQDDKVLLREICKWEFSSRLKSLFLSPICIRYWFLHFNRTQNLEERFGQTQIPTSNGNEKKLHWSPSGHQYFRHYLVSPSKKNGYRLFPIAEVLYSYFTYSILCKQSKDERESFGENGQDAFLDKFLFKVCRTYNFGQTNYGHFCTNI